MYNYKQYAKTYPQYFILHKGLPKGYIQQKYITVTRKQYVDTDINIMPGDIINVEVTAVVNRPGVLLSVYGDGTGQIVHLNTGRYRSVGYMSFEQIGQSPEKLTVTALDGINGLLALFRAHGNTSPVFEGDIYNLNVMRNNQIIMNLISSLDDKGVPCLYDIVNEKTYYSNSNTPFVKGE